MTFRDTDYIMAALSIFGDNENGNVHFLAGIETAKEIVESAPVLRYDELTKLIRAALQGKVSNHVADRLSSDVAAELIQICKNKINPCKICGGKADVAKHSEEYSYVVICEGCGARSYPRTKDERSARAIWNASNPDGFRKNRKDDENG